MNSKYIVRQPIKDAENRIIGYEIQYYGENQAFSGGDGPGASDFAAADTIYNFLTLNTDKLLRGSLNFMTFTTTLLMKKTPRLFDKSELVIQIDDSVIIHPLAMRMVQQYAKEGYQIAVNEFQFAPRYLGILDGIDYIKLNFQSTPELTLKNIIEIARSMKKKCIAVGIDREELYQKALKLKVDALEGTYVAEKLRTKTHSSGYLQSNFFRLMVAVTRDEPDVEEIEQIISVDATLTYGLLKMANSCYCASGHHDHGTERTEAVGLSAERKQCRKPDGRGSRGIPALVLYESKLLQQPDELCERHAHLQAGGISDGDVFYSELSDRRTAGRDPGADPPVRRGEGGAFASHRAVRYAL